MVSHSLVSIDQLRAADLHPAAIPARDDDVLGSVGPEVLTELSEFIGSQGGLDSGKQFTFLKSDMSFEKIRQCSQGSREIPPRL